MANNDPALKLIEQLQRGQEDNAGAIGEILQMLAQQGVEIDNLKESSAKVQRVLSEGNGDSLVTQVALLRESVGRIETERKTEAVAVKDEQKDARQGSWQLWVALLTGVLALIGVIIQAAATLKKG